MTQPRPITRRDFNRTAVGITAAALLPVAASMAVPTRPPVPEWHAKLEQLVRETMRDFAASPSYEFLPWDFRLVNSGIRECRLSVTLGERLASYPFHDVIGLMHGINRDSFCCAPPGRLMFIGFETEHDFDFKHPNLRVTGVFSLRDRPWNPVWYRGVGLVNLTDAAGRLIYSPVDFNLIP